VPQRCLFPRATASSLSSWPTNWRSGLLRPGDDGQLNLPMGGHAELPGGGQRDYFT
jgi:hypothetical protein